MKQKFLATLLTLALSVSTLMGCGSSGDSDGPSQFTSVNGIVVSTEPAQSLRDPTTSNARENVVAGTHVTDSYTDERESSVTLEEGLDEEAVTKDEVSANTTNAIEGIVMLTLYRVGDTHYANAIVDAINPDTGATQNILSLQIPMASSNREYSFAMPEDIQRFGNFQDQFAPDYSKMAITRVETRNRSMHAGWLDKNGNFFDMTAAVGEAETSDFEDPVCYQAVGFTDDGNTFVYRKAVDLYNGFVFDTLGYYAVSVNNVQAGSWEMSPSDPYLHDSDEWRWLGKDYRPTDWLDDTHFYADNGRDSRIPCVLVDTEAGTMTEFIPGESRINWGVVASPDGQRVAFMSRSKLAPANTLELYTMNLTDQSTKQITTIHTPSDAHMPEMYGEYNGMIYVLCTVLDWK